MLFPPLWGRGVDPLWEDITIGGRLPLREATKADSRLIRPWGLPAHG